MCIFALSAVGATRGRSALTANFSYSGISGVRSVSRFTAAHAASGPWSGVNS